MDNKNATLFYRTEDLSPEDVLEYYVETPGDEAILKHLRSRVPVVLKGSRGVGKSFLLRVAEAQLRGGFEQDFVLPVYITFSRAALLKQKEDDFVPWMTARISSAVKRSLTKFSLNLSQDSTLYELTKATSKGREIQIDDFIIDQYESLSTDSQDVRGTELLPDSDQLRESLEEACEELGLKRIILLVDEAAHVFVPAQQRQFFTLMRDLRSPKVAVKAAVYPGVTSYGTSFQPVHDSTVVAVDRFVTHENYLESMREIVVRQVVQNSPPTSDSASRDGKSAKNEKSIKELKVMEQNREAFNALAFASMGNPRVLLKTYAEDKLSKSSVKATIKRYFTEDIWSEHSSLADRYPGHSELVDWGRKFIQDTVLEDLHERNENASEWSSALWIHRNAPASVKMALSLLCYSGILVEDRSQVRATRSELGTRYFVNFGCTMSVDAEPIEYGTRLIRKFSPKRMQEFGAKHRAFDEIAMVSILPSEEGRAQALERRLAQSADLLDLTDFQKAKLKELNLKTIGQVLLTDESQYKTLHYVGDSRARQISNAATTAVIEYISG